jgi:RND family efflux transporter MFP subunit
MESKARVLVLAAAVLAACASPEPAAQQAPRAAVSRLTIVESLAPDYKAVSAILTSRDAGDARARIGGTLTRLLVREGEFVRRGQVLAVITDQRLALEAQAGVSEAAAADAAAERARGDEQRFRQLFERGFLAQARMDQIRAERRAAEAQARAARSLSAARAEAYAQGRVLAPADGRVTRAAIPQGAVVMAGDVVVAIATGARVLRLEVPEADARLLAEGQDIRIVGVGTNGAPVSVPVRQVYPAIENGRVMADLDAQALPGEFVGARVRILVPVGQRKAIVVPARYIATRFGVDYVRLERPGGAIDAPVQRGGAVPTEGLPDSVEILSGLNPGDVILSPSAASGA